MLLELDRAAMSAGSSQTLLTDQDSRSASGAGKETLAKLHVFRYSLFHQLLVYLFIAATAYVGLSALINDSEFLAGIWAILLFMIIPLWFVSVVVRVSSSGINVSRLFGIAHWEIPWSEIKSIKQNALGQGIKIITHAEKVVEIPSQLYGYPTIVNMLMQIRPDLFNVTETFQTASSAQDLAAPFSAGIKIFEKNFLGKYGPIILLIFGCLFSTGAVLANPPGGILAGIFLLIVVSVMLDAAHTVKLEENRFSARSFCKRWELRAQQINDISMISVRNWRGISRTYIRVDPQEGKAFKLSGFPEGNELMLAEW
jgi:hypothetical protein